MDDIQFHLILTSEISKMKEDMSLCEELERVLPSFVVTSNFELDFKLITQ